MTDKTIKTSPIEVSVDELLAYRQAAQSMGSLRKRSVSSRQVGEMRSPVLGRGLDFSQLREYQAGDDIRQIDWNVTARTGKPYTKLFSLERERPYFVAIDLRSSMLFATQCAFKSVIAARLAAILSWSVVLANDRVGGLVFTDNQHIEIKPEGGRRGLMKLFRAIVQLQSSDTDEPNPNAFSDAIFRLARLAHTGSTIWFLSDFNGFDKRSQAGFSPLMQHNEVNAIQLIDVMESELPPPGKYRLKAAQGSFHMDTHSKHLRTAYHAQFLEHQALLRQFFLRGHHYYTSVKTTYDLVEKAIAIGRHLPEIQRDSES
jgi:uncharacterized protein (DUF58 family)